jgi:putative SOS response-associated peptidase YedK
MCGRYATTRSAADLSKLFEALDDTGGALAPDYNVAPTDPAPIVRMSTSQGGRVVSVARWGLIPPWADGPKIGARMINARAETVAELRAFAPSFANRRCLVPADGWYEWTRTETGKVAYFMTLRGMNDEQSMTLRGMTSAQPLVFAGLWTASRFGLSCSVLTMAAQGELAKVHDRMPLLLPADRWAQWLTAPADAALLAPPPQTLLDSVEIRPVGPAVGDVRNDGPELTRRIVPAPIQIELF